MTDFSHSFALCAYKESPYLRECLQSLRAQTLPANVFIATSTPSLFLEEIAKEFDVPLHVGTHQSGIGRDWNFAYSRAETDFVTIAHQDDLYEPEYLSSIATYFCEAKNPILFSTDYGELRGETRVFHNKLLNTKRRVNRIMNPKAFRGSRFMRNRLLSAGCFICCPSVCLNRKRFPDFRFSETMTCNLDWDAWSRLAKEDGEFIYIPRPLMLHRIHEESETTSLLADGTRSAEDFEIFNRYWPRPIARILTRAYSSSQKSNSLEDQEKPGGSPSDPVS